MVLIVYFDQTFGRTHLEVLSDILQAMRVEGSVYFCDMLEAPWVKDFSATTTASFHLVRRGECRVHTEEGPDFLGPGDLIFLSAGVDHQLSSYSAGGEKNREIPGTMLLCGYCEFDESIVNPLLRLFPRMTIIRSEELTKHSWLRGTLDQLGTEYLSQSPGAELVVNKLTEVVLIELIRINFGREKQSPFLNALGDKAISKALALLHSKPEQAWTLDLLASEVALSRAAFARRFKNLIGQGMFQYLTELRVQKAKELLLSTQLPVADIAQRMGYESDISFVKTFKKYCGMTPRQYLMNTRAKKEGIVS